MAREIVGDKATPQDKIRVIFESTVANMQYDYNKESPWQPGAGTLCGRLLPGARKDQTLSQQLCSAAERGDPAKVRELLDRGADVDWHSKSRGITALWEAVHQGHLEVARLLLECGANVDHAPPANGMTPLHLACSLSQLPLIELLLQAGADPNRGTPGWNITPLMTAAQTGAGAIVRRLLEAGADASVRTKDGRTALSMAERKGRTEVVMLLQATGAAQAVIAPAAIPLPWPAVSATGERENSPEAVLFGFLHAMNRWERDAARLFKAHQNHFVEESLVSLQALFAMYCTPRPRPYGRNGSFQTPPEYDPGHEVLLELRAENPRRTVLVTRNSHRFGEHRYVVLKQKGRWLLDSKKIRPVGGDESDWSDWSL